MQTEAKPGEAGADKLQEKHSWCKQSFESAEQLTSDNRAKQERDRDYYDNKQLTPKEVKALEKRGQPPLTRPFIKRKIDYIVGLEIKKRSDPKAYPRTPKHEHDADAVTQALRYAADRADFKRVKTAVAKEFFVEGGPTGAYIGVEQKANGRIDITALQIPWDRCFVDPHSREPDYSDATYKGFITWLDKGEAESRYPDATDVIAATVDLALANTKTYDDRPRWQKWVDTKRKRVRIIEIYYEEAGQWHCAALTEAGFVKQPHVSEYLDQDGEPECPLELTSANVDRDNNRYGEVRPLIDIQDSVNKRVSKLTHLLNVRQARFGRGVKDADKQSKELAKPDGKVIADKDEFEILPTNDLAAGQAQMLQFDMLEMQSAGPNASLMGKGPEGASGRAILANQQGGQIELDPLLDILSLWELNCYRKIWNRIRQFWTGEMWLRVTDDERNLSWVGLNAPMTNADYAKRQGVPPEAMQGMDPNAPAMDPNTGQPMMMNTLAEIDVDIIIEKGPDTVTLQQEQFETLAQVQGIPPDILIELSSLPNKDKIMDRLTGKTGPGGQPAEPPPPPEVIKAQADAAEKDKQREFEAAKAVGDRELEMQKLELEKVKIQGEQQKIAAELQLQQAQLALEARKLSIEEQRLQLEAAKIAQAARDAEEQRAHDREKTAATLDWEQRKTGAEFSMRAQEGERAANTRAEPKEPKDNGSNEGMKAMGEGLKAVAAALSKPKTIKRGADGRAMGID